MKPNSITLLVKSSFFISVNIFSFSSPSPTNISFNSLSFKKKKML